MHKSVQYAQLQRSEIVQLCESVQYAQFCQGFLCNFAKVYKVYKTIGLKLCNFAKVCNLYIFFKKNPTCFVQGSQYKTCVVQSAENSPKMLKIFVQYGEF